MTESLPRISPDDARQWYDTVYSPWVTGAIGGVLPMGGTDSLFGSARSVDPVTGKDAAAAGSLGFIDNLDPANWLAPWDLLIHLDEMWDNFWDHALWFGLGCCAVVVLLPCIIPWALIVLVAVAFGARPLLREKGTPPALAQGSGMPDPLPGWLLERGVIRDLSGPPSNWSTITQHLSRQGLTPESWQPKLGFRIAADDPERDWYQALLRDDLEGGRVQLWSVLVWPSASIAVAPSGSSIQTLSDGWAIAIVTHPVMGLGFSANPVSWEELEAMLSVMRSMPQSQG